MSTSKPTRTTNQPRHIVPGTSRAARRPGGKGRLVVVFACKPNAMAAPGGGEVQMLATARSLAAEDVEVLNWQLGDALPEATDCVHLFGSVPEHLPLVEAARRRGLPVVLSTIAWFELANCWREPRGLLGRVAASARFVARAACPRLPSWRRQLYQGADLLLPNSNAEADQLTRYFGVAPDRIHVVPNAANPRFATADPRPFIERVGAEGFVLYAGRIEPRKNQLGFLRAMRGAGVPVVVLGDPVPEHKDYFAACRRAADQSVVFVPRIDHDAAMLTSAYAACGCLALASWFETPGLVALEAGMSGVPLVLPNGGSAREYFGNLATYVRPNDLPGIHRAVMSAMARGRNPQLADLVRTNYSWNTTARITREAYERVV